MKTSGILQDALTIHSSRMGDATHFALHVRGKLRYLVALQGGKKELSRNNAAYNGILVLFLKLLPLMPFWLIKRLGVGHYVRVDLHAEIAEVLTSLGLSYWNLLIGTYDGKQKLVFQCFDDSQCVYVKVGNQATQRQMRAEMLFLEKYKEQQFRYFRIPDMIACRYADEVNPFHVQATREFLGNNMSSVITEDIIQIYQEVSELERDGEQEFSHGDFAPWNLRKIPDSYILFDWEHCGMRMKGYDLVYYGVISKVALAHMKFDEAFDGTLTDIRRFLPDFSMDKAAFYQQFCRTIKTLDF